LNLNILAIFRKSVDFIASFYQFPLKIFFLASFQFKKPILALLTFPSLAAWLSPSPFPGRLPGLSQHIE
jgi:hypothetical protein